MLRVRINIDGEIKVLNVKEISITSYSDAVVQNIITVDDEQYHCVEALGEYKDSYDIDYSFSEFTLFQG